MTIIVKKDVSQVLNGLKLGMLLQFGGIGPICFLLFQLAALLPFKSVYAGVWGVTLADAVYIYISLLGIIGVVKQVKYTSDLFKKLNGLIIVFLGLSFLLMIFADEISYLDVYDWNGGSVFMGVFLLTILNPITIICYTGVFNAQLIHKEMSNKELHLFGLGTLLSTPIFMTFVVLFGSLGSAFMPMYVVSILNLMVGSLLVYWGLRSMFPKLAFKKDKKTECES